MPSNVNDPSVRFIPGRRPAYGPPGWLTTWPSSAASQVGNTGDTPVLFDTRGFTAMTSGSTSTIIDISAAANGSTVYLWCTIGAAPTGTISMSGTGWANVVTQTEDGTFLRYALFRKVKQDGDSTFTASWLNSAKGTFSWVSYTGLDSVTPDEQATLSTNGVTSRTAVPTASVTPTAANRRAVCFFAARTSTSTNKPISWVNDAALVERLDIDNNGAGSAPWVGHEIADSNGAVAQVAQSYTATHGPANEAHDGSVILFLIPSSGGATQNVTPSGIPSEEREGAANVATVIAANSIVNGDVGEPSISSVISTAGVTSAEGSGHTAVTSVISATGIGTAEAAGNASVANVNSIFATGIQSQDQEGAATVTSIATIQGTAVPSQEAFGQALVEQAISATGIASAERFGQAAVTSQIAATGISSAEAEGEPTVSSIASIQASGIASAETFGPAQTFLTQTISASSITTAERLGSVRLDLTLPSSGIASEDRVGQISTTVFVSPTGIGSQESPGEPTVLLAQTVSATSIQSDERVGFAVATPGPATIAASGIASQELVGFAQSVSSATVSTTSIVSAEASGKATLLLAQSISCSGIDSLGAYGAAVVTPGPVTVQAFGVSSLEVFGAAQAATVSTVSASSIASAETFGEPTLNVITAINAAGILSETQLGEPAIVSTATVQARGIVSEQALGAPSLAWLIRGYGIQSAETFGKLSITVGAVTISAYGIVSGQLHGAVQITALPLVAPEPDTEIKLILGDTTIKVILGNTSLQLKNAKTEIKVIGGKSVLELTADEVTVGTEP